MNWKLIGDGIRNILLNLDKVKREKLMWMMKMVIDEFKSFLKGCFELYIEFMCYFIYFIKIKIYIWVLYLELLFLLLLCLIKIL